MECGQIGELVQPDLLQLVTANIKGSQSLEIIEIDFLELVVLQIECGQIGELVQPDLLQLVSANIKGSQSLEIIEIDFLQLVV